MGQSKLKDGPSQPEVLIFLSFFKVFDLDIGDEISLILLSIFKDFKTTL